MVDKVHKESVIEKEQIEEMFKLFLDNKPDKFFDKIYKDKEFWKKFGPVLKQKLADKSLSLSIEQKE